MNSSARRRQFQMRSAYINDSAGPRLDEASERERGRIARHKNENPFFLRAIAVKGRNHTPPNYAELKREGRTRMDGGGAAGNVTSKLTRRLRIPAAIVPTLQLREQGYLFSGS